MVMPIVLVACSAANACLSCSATVLCWLPFLACSATELCWSPLHACSAAEVGVCRIHDPFLDQDISPGQLNDYI